MKEQPTILWRGEVVRRSLLGGPCREVYERIERRADGHAYAVYRYEGMADMSGQHGEDKLGDLEARLAELLCDARHLLLMSGPIIWAVDKGESESGYAQIGPSLSDEILAFLKKTKAMGDVAKVEP